MERSQRSLIRTIAVDMSKNKGLILLSLVVLLNALGVVYTSFLNRQATVYWDTLLGQQDELNVEWHHLLLEEQTYADYHRVYDVATKQLRMFRPQPKHEHVLREP